MQRHDTSLPATPQSVAVARRLVTGWLEDCGCTAGVVSDARLAISEAVTNVVLHGYVGREVNGVDLHTERDNGDVVVVVRDYGNGLVPRSDSPGLGFGLDIIEQVTRCLDVRHPADGGVELRMSFTLAA